MRNKYNMQVLENIKKIEELMNEGVKIINEGTKEYNYIRYNVSNSYDSLEECYGHYSSFKDFIYNKYLEVYKRLLFEGGFKISHYGINSYNIMQFTLSMCIYKDGYFYKLYITKAYNKIIVWEDK